MSEHTETLLAQLGNRSDKSTGAVSAPIYLSTTFAHPGLGQSTGYDYTRTANPTRDILEMGLAQLENGSKAIVTSSGMSAISLVFDLFPSGSKILVSRDLYGGSFRYFQELEKRGIAEFIYFSNFEELTAHLSSPFDAIFLETPTNPLMSETSIADVAKLAEKQGALLIVDNTFLTPLRQRPLDEGADIVIHSGTKYLTGHNDILAGVVIAKEETIAKRLLFLSNTVGPSLSSFDCWLFIRSLKTFSLRFEKQEANAQEIAKYLRGSKGIKEVLYPEKGAMISIRVTDDQKIGPFLEALELITFAESLGGVETLITYPTTQTHADIPKELRESYGLTPDLLRLSIGIENCSDLIADLVNALKVF